MGIVYLVQPAELVGTNRYKVGASAKSTLDRVLFYKSGTRYLGIFECVEPFKLEKKIIEKLNTEFRVIAGKEYFEGNETKMRCLFNQITVEYLKKLEKCFIVDDSKLNKEDTEYSEAEQMTVPTWVSVKSLTTPEYYFILQNEHHSVDESFQLRKYYLSNYIDVMKCEVEMLDELLKDCSLEKNNLLEKLDILQIEKYQPTHRRVFEEHQSLAFKDKRELKLRLMRELNDILEIAHSHTEMTKEQELTEEKEDKIIAWLIEKQKSVQRGKSSFLERVFNTRFHITYTETTEYGKKQKKALNNMLWTPELLREDGRWVMVINNILDKYGFMFLNKRKTSKRVDGKSVSVYPRRLSPNVNNKNGYSKVYENIYDLIREPDCAYD